MSIAPNFTIVTLGVASLETSIAFYRALGWEQRGGASESITWFRTSGTWLGLYGYADLAADIGVAAEPPTDYRGITLALNFNDEEAVDHSLADPDGHLWEAAFAPGFRVADDGTIDIQV